MPFTIVRNDITKMKTDIIVNAANNALQRGGGVCGAIFEAAGSHSLQKECDSIGHCPTGQAVITKGYKLPAKYIIHTPAPIWKTGSKEETDLLHSSYTNSLRLAEQKGGKSISFPLISSGIYGFPKDIALDTAISAISSFLQTYEMDIFLVVFDKNSYQMSKTRREKIQRYIDDNYAQERLFAGYRENSISLPLESQDEFADADEPTMIVHAQMPAPAKHRKLADIVSNIDESFSAMLLRLIDQKDMSDVQVYKKANIDRKLFSKIRSSAKYTPSKNTAVAFAIALNLSIDEAQDLLAKAGYTLSDSSKFDVIIKYFIHENNYNIFEINEALFAFDQHLLGA